MFCSCHLPICWPAYSNGMTWAAPWIVFFSFLCPKLRAWMMLMDLWLGNLGGRKHFSEDYVLFAVVRRLGSNRRSLLVQTQSKDKAEREDFFLCMASAAPMIFWSERENLSPSCSRYNCFPHLVIHTQLIYMSSSLFVWLFVPGRKWIPGLNTEYCQYFSSWLVP